MSKHNVWKKTFETLVEETSWDRPKSAPYSRLKNSKRTSKCQFTILENLEKPKNGPSGAPGPASVSPWALKRKKVSQCQKTETGTLWGFSTSILSQNIKKLKGEIFIFGKKYLTMPKQTERGDPLGFFNIYSVAKQHKN